MGTVHNKWRHLIKKRLLERCYEINGDSSQQIAQVNHNKAIGTVPALILHRKFDIEAEKLARIITGIEDNIEK